MRKLKKSDVSKNLCNYCRYYRERWTCSLEECFQVTEERQRRKKMQQPVTRVSWEVIS